MIPGLILFFNFHCLIAPIYLQALARYSFLMSFYQFSIGRCHLSRRNGPINLLKIVCFRAKNIIIGEKSQIASLDVVIDETSGSCLKKYSKVI